MYITNMSANFILTKVFNALYIFIFLRFYTIKLNNKLNMIPIF